MEKKTSSKTIDALLGEPELSSLVELQKFISDELGSPGGATDFSRSFRPLTDGLGLESPDPKKKIDPPKPTRPFSERRDTGRLDDLFSTDPIPAKPMETPSTLGNDRDPMLKAFQNLPESTPAPRTPTATPPPPPTAPEQISPLEQVAASRLITSVRPPEAPALSNDPEVIRHLNPEPTLPPPSLPKADFSRRFLAAVLDHVFIWTLFSVLVILTGMVLEGLGPAQLSTWFFTSFSNPKFVRIIALEFSVLWLTYLVMAVGVLDMTFGMWVWGLRLNYPNVKEGEWLTLRKCTRLVMSFLFYPIPVLAPLLFIRSKGRNLVDWISGSTVYRFAH